MYSVLTDFSSVVLSLVSTDFFLWFTGAALLCGVVIISLRLIKGR